MYAFDIYQARAAECQQRARDAQTDDEKHSWLALADSWLMTAELRQSEAPQLQIAWTHLSREGFFAGRYFPKNLRRRAQGSARQKPPASL
jgi:hypothetical protein